MDSERWEKIQEIFHAAGDLGRAERERYLAQASDGDPGLREEVQRLLAGLESDGDFLHDAISEEAARAVARTEPAAGDRIGPYRLIEKLGQGGMGTVYRAARADRQYEREVAIKLVRADYSSAAGLIRRFRVERQILANLDHPNIARMLDGGITGDGLPYLVMEFVGGVPIDAFASAARLDVRARLELFRLVCAAVQYAHRNLIVHRDIKPSNILVTPGGVPKLLDFGIAKLLKSSPGSEAALTRSAERLMTVEYASPEQIRGEPITTATDVYSLGLVLYELLTSQRPFDFKAASTFESQRMICQEEPRRPSTALAPRDAVAARKLGGELDNIVLKALRKEPEARYVSVEQFSEDIRNYLDGFPVAASADSRRYRLSKFARRHRLAVVAASVFVLTLAGFGIAMATLAARVARERDTAQAERVRAQEVSQFLGSLFRASDPFEAKGRQVTAKDLLDAGAKRIGKDLGKQPGSRAELLDVMAGAYDHLGLLADAEALYEREMEAQRQVFGPESLEVARTLREIADVKRSRSDLAGADKALRRALAIQQKRLPPDAMELSHTQNNLSIVLQQEGEFGKAEELVRNAIAISSRYPAERGETLVMMSNLGSILGDLGKLDDAEKTLREVLSERRKLLGDDHPQVSISRTRLGFLLNRKAMWAEAEGLHREALASFLRIEGEDHVDVVASLNNLGVSLREQGKLVEAEQTWRRMIAIGKRALGRQTLIANAHSSLGSLLGDLGRRREADAEFHESLEMFRSLFGRGSIGEGRALCAYGEFLARTGRLGPAREAAEEGLRIREKKLGPAHLEVGAALYSLGEVCRLAGQAELAESDYARAIGIEKSYFAAGSVSGAKYRLGLAKSRLARGDRSGASETAREAVAVCLRLLPAEAWQIAEARSVLGAASGSQAMLSESAQKLSRVLGPEMRISREAEQSVSRFARAER